MCCQETARAFLGRSSRNFVTIKSFTEQKVLATIFLCEEFPSPLEEAGSGFIIRVVLSFFAIHPQLEAGTVSSST